MSFIRRKGIAEFVATIALLGVTIGLAGGLAATYYGWLHSYSAQSAHVGVEASLLSSSRVSLVAFTSGTPSKVWLMNCGSLPTAITSAYSDGSLLYAAQWRLYDAVTGNSSAYLLPGRLYVLLVNATSRIDLYFDSMFSLTVGMGS